jgi:hypothetical protein
MDAADLVAGIDDDGLAGHFVAEDGAVAGQRADGKGFQNHGLIVSRGGVVRDKVAPVSSGRDALHLPAWSVDGEMPKWQIRQDQAMARLNREAVLNPLWK